MRKLICNCLVVCLAGIATAYGADGSNNPETLASKLAATYKAGDMDAALALFDAHHGQSAPQRYFMQLVLGCFEDFTHGQSGTRVPATVPVKWTIRVTPSGSY